MGRLTDHDKDYGPLTVGKTDTKMLSLSYKTKVSHSDRLGKDVTSNTLTWYGFGYALRLNLPGLIPAVAVKVYPVSWDDATKKRLGRDYYNEYIHREYGFTVSEELVSFCYGTQSHDSLYASGSTAKQRRKSFFLPWKSYRLTMDKLYDGEGRLRWSRSFGKRYSRENQDAQYQVRKKMPKQGFLVKDFDGEEIVTLVHVSEMRWERGEGWFKWLSWLMPGMYRRSLEIEFKQQIGPRKGSWKGGLMGLSFDMRDAESVKEAFMRFIEEKATSDRDLKGVSYARDLGTCL